MISNTMAKKLNGQINKEFYSAYFYMSMSAYSESENLKGVAAWSWPSTTRRWRMR